MRRDSRSRSRASVEDMASRFIVSVYGVVVLGKIKTRPAKRGRVIRRRFSRIYRGLIPRRPQAGFDLVNQIGAAKLYVKSAFFLPAMRTVIRAKNVRWQQGKTFEKFSGGQAFAAGLLQLLQYQRALTTSDRHAKSINA